MPDWKKNIRHITDGEAVSSGVTSRPDKALEGNLQYLKDLVDATQLGEVLVIRDATVSSDVLVGQPVHWNATTGRFEKALAVIETNAESKTTSPKASAEVIGVVQKKTNSTLADIVTMGWVELDLSNAIDDEIIAGRYYLSANESGKLTKQRPPVSVPVLFTDGVGNALVLPITRNFLNDHIHYSFDLTCRPAGDHYHLSGRHEITNPDSSQQGWLPADHESFGGKAPSKAVFGYNLAAHDELESVWPPLPITAAAMTWDKGDNENNQTIGGVDIPLGLDGLCHIDANGIWWMSDCDGNVPWPEDLVDSSSSSASWFEDGYGSLDSEGSYSSSNSSESHFIPECPHFDKMRLTIHYARMSFATDKSVVTSLQPAEDSPIKVQNCAGKDSTTGDLFLDLSLDLAVIDAEKEGYQVVKTVEGAEYKRGPVVEGLFAGGDAQLSSSKTLDVDGNTLYQGRVTVTVPTDIAGRELMPQIVRLDDVMERYYDEVPYLGFSSGRESSIRIRFHVPPTGISASATMKLRVAILGRISGTLPDLSVTYRRIPRGTSSAAALPTSTSDEKAVTFDPTSITLASANQYAEVESASFPAAVDGNIEAGDTLLITITRGSSDTYAGELGLLRIGAIFD
tara:strand:+ start:1254 stop:3131 length:1878 start_codon:yes stop_codon:yes gene_type:complete